MSGPFADLIGNQAGTWPYLLLLRHWLDREDLAGRAESVTLKPNELAVFLAERQADPDWRGCLATGSNRPPLFAMTTVPDPKTRAIGSVNCVIPEAGALIGINLELAGIEEALDRVELDGRGVVIIGTGSLAKAAIAYLDTRSVEDIVVLARSGQEADALAAIAPATYIEVLPLDRGAERLAAATLIVNNSPLGLPGAPPLPPAMRDAVAACGEDKVYFDTNVVAGEPALLGLGRLHGGRIIDGSTMLIGQARLAFELFFATAAPAADLIVHDLLTQELIVQNAWPPRG